MAHPSDESSRQGRLPRAGEVIAGNFVVERTLGVGGMGGVFAARDVQLNRRVAVKVMLPHLTSNAEFAGRFMREAKAASSLHSNHVARVYDAGYAADGSPYMVMELLAGKDLDDHVRARGPLPVHEAVGCVLEACDAIAEAHRRGIVHRDLKPSNLFVAEQPGHAPKIKVLDFGISKQTNLDAGPGAEATQLTATDSTLGSPHYMSPEQLRSSKKVDRRADIWSLGVILHKILTGHLAFETDSIGAHLVAIVTESPKPLRLHRPDAPPELEAVILRCLQKDLPRRYQNVGQLALALAPFAPPTAHAIIERIVAVVGREASTAPLPPVAGPGDTMGTSTGTALPVVVVPAGVNGGGGTLAMAPPDAPTIAGWTPSAPQKPPRRGLLVAVIGTGLVVAAGAGVGAQRMLTSRATALADAAVVARATAAPTAEPTTAASAALPPGEVSINLDVEPKDATVEIDGVPVQGTSLRLPRSSVKHTLTVRAPGYGIETREISAADNGALAIALKRAPGAAGKAGPLPRAAAPPPAEPQQGKKVKGPMETSL